MLDIDLQFGYNLQDNINVGIKWGRRNIIINKKYRYDYYAPLKINNYLGTFSYYFNSGKSSFVSFVGGGIGIYDLSDNQKFGSLLTAGFELGKFRMALEYNLMPKTTEGSFLPRRYSYYAATAGFYIGGGKWNKIKGKSEYMDKASNVVIPSKYKYKVEFSENMAALKVGNKWGFIDETSKEVISFKYDDAGNFSEGLAKVNLNGKWGYIDKTGNEIIPFKYDDVGRFSEGLARVTFKDKWGYIDKNGKVVITFMYDNAGEFSEGLARVYLARKWGFIDKTGKVVIPFKYDEVEDFSEGQVRVKFNGKWIFIDKTGKEVSQNTPAVNPNEERSDIENIPTANSGAVSAHDVITLRNGDEIKAKVTEISLSEVRYRRFDNLDGPTIVVPRSDVFAINYANGTREVINPVSVARTERTALKTERTASNSSYGDIAFGSNFAVGVGDSYTHFGFGFKFLYNAANQLRLAGEFDYFPKQDYMSWWDAFLYGHYLLPVSDRVNLFPAVGFGMAGFKVGSASGNWLALSLGFGADFALSNNLFLNIELRTKHIDPFNNSVNRINFVTGLGYKF